MNVQQIISSGLSDIAMSLASILIGMGGYYLKKHFSAKQIATAAGIAEEAVRFVAQAALQFGLTTNEAKYQKALERAKELAAKIGISLTDNQWETLLESAYKQVKDELAQLVGKDTPYTQAEIQDMIKTEVQKVAPNIPVDTINDLVKQEISKLNLTVNVVPAPVVAQTNPPAPEMIK